MAAAARRTLLALFFTFCAPQCGWAEKTLRPQSGKHTAADKVFRESWEPSIHLDGRPVDRFVFNSNKPSRSHRFTKVNKESRPHSVEDVDPEWINLDGFAVLSHAPVNNSSAAGFVRMAIRSNSAAARRKTRVDRTAQPAGTAFTRTHRRAPQSSSGPRQPEKASPGTPLLERRHQQRTKPQADQRNRQAQKLTSESVHVVSLQAQKALGQSLPNNGAATAKTSPPEPPEYEAQDISVRVMSAKSVLISWVDPAVEMRKVDPGATRSYTVRFREKGESARWEYKESNQRRIMIDTLSADGMYEFSVRISQGEKQGKWSVSVFQRTPESAPSGPPENFEVKPLRGKGTAVIATWDPPEEPNGRIREYILSYTPAIKPFGMKTITYREGTTKATIDGLTPGERYIFKIRATNRRGMGPQSKAFSVAMPRSSGTASSLSKTKDTQTTSKPIIEQDTDKKSDLEPTEVPEGPVTTPKPHNTNRRVRPLSQTRSYHSIFSSIRGSVRNTANRGSTRGAEREHEEQVDDKKPTTPPPVVETTTVVPETKELDNDVSPLSEEEVDYDVEPLTTETPSLKVLTPSPTKSAFKRPYRPNRRPIKIRVHQKTGSKSTYSVSSADSSSSSSSSSTSSSSSSATSPVSSSSENSFSSSSRSSLSHTSLLPSSHVPESEPSKKDNIESTNHETAKIHQKPNLTSTRNSLTHGKPLVVVNSQETESAPTDTSSSMAERSSNAGSRFGSRFGHGRRQPGSFFRGNSTRLLKGYKPAVTTQFHLPSQSKNQVISNTGSSDKTHSTLTERNQNQEISNPSDPKSSKSTSRSTLDSQTTSDSSVFDKSQPASESRSHDSKISQDSEASTSHGSPIHNLNRDISGSSQSVSQRHSSSTSQNNKNSRGSDTSSNRDISPSKRTENTVYTNKDDIEGKAEGSTLNSRAQTTQDIREEDRQDESSNKKTVGPRTRISSSFAERFPWLASQYPGRFTSSSRTSYPRQDARTPLTRVSSSVGAGRPLLRETPTRVSGAAGASGVSLKQETTEDLKITSRPDSMKNSVVLNSGKSSLPNQHAVTGDTRNPATVSSSETFMSSNSGSLSLEKSSALRDFSEVTHKEMSKSEDNMRENVDTLSTERNGKLTDLTSVQTNPASPSVHRHEENNESVATKETSSRARAGTSTGISPSIRRSGVGTNGRVRSSLIASRQLSGSKLSVRPHLVQNSRLGGSTPDSSSTSSLNMPKPVLTSASDADHDATVKDTESTGGNAHSGSSLPSSRDTFRNQGGRTRYPIVRGNPNNGGRFKPGNGNGKNGKPNLTAMSGKDTTSSHGSNKAIGHKFITGPDGTRWVVDLEKGVLMNQDGQVLQDSQGKAKRVVLGDDGRTIFDHMGSPLVSQEGIALFGHGRNSQPVVNPKDKVLMIGGKPVLGLDVPPPKTSTTTTTTLAPTTTLEPTTDWTTEDFSTALPYPTCPPGTFSKRDEFGYPILDPEGILDCYPEEESSGMEMDPILTVAMMPDALNLDKDELLVQTTLPPTTTTIATTTTTTTTAIPSTEPQVRVSNRGPVSEFDLSGKKRFTAPFVNYIQKDPGAPCSLTEALEYLQVDVLENLMEKDRMAVNQNQPPKRKPQNFTVVAMEGCHSFIILDWAKPLKDDMVSGYMVHSASYDDILNNRWSSRISNGTHLPVENLKPNSRYYFKVQAKNVFGLGPFSETLTYVTESDDPLLIDRPPGGEPIWIPFTFKYNPVHSSCKGSQYVKRTWYRKFVGVVLCNSLRYKIFMGDGLREPFYSIGDTLGQGEDHCQFVDSHKDGRTGPAYLSETLPSAQGYYRAYRQEPVTFGVIGRRTSHPFVGWYECGVPIPGKW
ncbi:fibronectin type III domain-containing protein 1 isoform X3 [Poecilia latipinna]|uniref:fibronectin type III domain-containing protein 1 isoform X3 n=1 Tax=Poecilia latipinna TaxID=48699 RepID=UPI00072E0030|nr:PREDICTED: fibronectin type III domain-containing protein 1 isoform X3 [Poecilia latipinna]